MGRFRSEIQISKRRSGAGYRGLGDVAVEAIKLLRWPRKKSGVKGEQNLEVNVSGQGEEGAS